MQTWRGREKKIIENKTLGSRFLVGQGYFTVTRSLRLLKVYCAKSSINLIRFNLLDIRRHYQFLMVFYFISVIGTKNLTKLKKKSCANCFDQSSKICIYTQNEFLVFVLYQSYFKRCSVKYPPYFCLFEKNKRRSFNKFL